MWAGGGGTKRPAVPREPEGGRQPSPAIQEGLRKPYTPSERPGTPGLWGHGYQPDLCTGGCPMEDAGTDADLLPGQALLVGAWHP